MNIACKLILSSLLLFTPLLFASPGQDQKGHPHCQGGIFQYSTINALMEKYLDGGMSIQRLSRKGDFGIGTYNGLEGEMLALNGTFYQLKSDGKAYQASDAVQTPFATVTHFTPNKTLTLPEKLNFEQILAFLAKETRPGNQIQAIRIDGTFRNLKLRSAPKQTPPYRTLTDITKTDMAVFDHPELEGTMVGFFFPDYMSQLNVSGYHFHFIDKDRKLGGHVLALDSVMGNISVQTTNRFKMVLPTDDEFNSLSLGNVEATDIEVVEKGKE